MSKELVNRIRTARFTPVRLREGYDMAQVDQLLDELEDAVAGGRPVRPVVEAARFAKVRLREGYDMADVDDFLAEMARCGPPYPDSEPVPAPVVSEKRGLLARVLGRS